MFRLFAHAISLLTCASVVAADGKGLTILKDLEFGSLKGEEALIDVPENRNDQDSRTIDVHFLRFQARGEARLPPVFILPGGPGGFIGETHVRSAVSRNRYNSAREVLLFSRLRDVVVVNQRGVSKAPTKNKLAVVWTASAGDPRKPRSQKEAVPRLAKGFAEAVRNCAEQGFDLRGYDILHLVDDVEAIRKALGYDKIALRGTSFGSQWSLAYQRRYPERVERMLLAGVEPLDHGFDHPQWIWNVYARIETQARKSLKLPKEGLSGAAKSVIERLEKKLEIVRGVHPRRDLEVNLKLGAEDFQYYLHRRFPLPPMSFHFPRGLGMWPKFVMEVYGGDYDYLASRTIDDRPERYRGQILLTLVDNSLGISKGREEEFRTSAAHRWLGDINFSSMATRMVTPTPVISDDFRQTKRSDTPVLMVHGDLDLATPIENAEELLKSFPNGKLIRVLGGTHGALSQANSVDEKFTGYLVRFMEAKDPTNLEVPATIELPTLKFMPLGGPSLFDLLVREK